LDSIDDGKNSTQNFGKRQSTTKVTVNTFAYLAKATPLAPDPSITEIVKPLMELFKAGGTQAIGGALASSSSSGSVPSFGEGLMKIAMAAPTVGVTSALMMEPGPLEGFAEGFAAVGMATGAIAVFVEGMLKGPGLEKAADFLTVKPHDFSPATVSLDMELVSDSSVEFEIAWRACRFNEITADISACTISKGAECSEKEKAKIRAKCTRLVSPMKKTCEIHIASWNRLAVTIVAPIPYGAAKIQPLFGLEIDFNTTPLWEIMENHKRFKNNMMRQQACAACLTTTNQHATFMVTGLKTQSSVLKGHLSAALMQDAIAKHFKLSVSQVQVDFKEFPVTALHMRDTEEYECCVKKHYWKDRTFVPQHNESCSTGPMAKGDAPWLEVKVEKDGTIQYGTHVVKKSLLRREDACRGERNKESNCRNSN